MPVWSRKSCKRELSSVAVPNCLLRLHAALACAALAQRFIISKLCCIIGFVSTSLGHKVGSGHRALQSAFLALCHGAVVVQDLSVCHRLATCDVEGALHAGMPSQSNEIPFVCNAGRVH